MAIPPRNPDRYRRQQRRRAFLGWGGGLAVVALIALGAILGGEEEQRVTVHVPYGETMTSGEYDAIEEGEEEAVVLERLDKTGRPESLTKNYVLELFPPPAEGVVCSYWEFSDEPQIFARLCFDEAGGELVQKLEADVHAGLEAGEGTIT